MTDAARRWPAGATRLAAIIGDPVRHSLSPVIQNAAFRVLDLDWVYVAFEVPAGRGAAAVAAMRALGIAGLSVTMPHKSDAAGAVDRLTLTAERVADVAAAVRQVVDLPDPVGDVVRGSRLPNGLELRQVRVPLGIDEGFDPTGRRCVVLGAGGAARAVVHALGDARAADIVVVNRTAARAEAAVAMAGEVARVGSAEDARDADLVVNATPVGMDGHSLAIDARHLRAGQLVVDLVYHPAATPLVEAARAAGASAANGLGMLVHQAGHQLRTWTGREPPLAVMSAAALAALARNA